MSLKSRLRLPNIQTLITLADQALVSGSNFLLGIGITRWMGLDAYGQFALAWMGVLLGLGLQQALVQMPMMTLRPQKVEADRRRYDQGVWALTLMWLIVAGVLVMGGVALSAHLQPEWKLSELNPWFPLALVALLAQDFFRRYGFVKGKPWIVLVIDAVAYGGILVAIGWLRTADILSVPVIYQWVAILFAIGAIIGLMAFRLWPNFGALIEVWKAHAHFSGWLIGKSVLQFFASNYFILAAGAMLGTTAIGALRMAQNLLGVTHVLFQAMENIVPVQAARAWAGGNRRALWQYLRLMTLRSGVAVGGLLLLLVLTGQWLIELVYGAQYVPYYGLLLGYCLLYVFIFFGYPLRFALRTLSQTQPIFWAYVVSTGFSLLAANYAVENWGLTGVITGLIISQVLMQAVYGGWLWQKNTGFALATSERKNDGNRL